MQVATFPFRCYTRPRLLPKARAAPGNGLPPNTDFRVANFSSVPYVMNFFEAPLRAAFPNTTMVTARLDRTSAPLAANHDAVVCFVNDTCDEEVLNQLWDGGVRLVALRCAGFDKVDVDHASKIGMKIVRVPTYAPRSVAEHAVALLMCLNRTIHLAYNRVWSGNYTLSGLEGFEVYGKTVGVIGTGAIGMAFCSIMKGFGCRVLAYDLKPREECTKMGVEYVPMDDLLAQSDVVSLHCPLMPSTFHMIGERELDIMKSTALLINVSRGGLVDTDALIDALERSTVAGAAMDVYGNEGNLFFHDFTRFTKAKRMEWWDRKFGTLKSFPNVLITPHSAFLTEEALANIAKTTIENLSEFATNRELTNEVKPMSVKK